MKLELKKALTACEVDVEGTLKRFSDNDELYISLLRSFVNEETMQQLNAAIVLEEWDRAFMLAHALKGLSGNLGLVPLFHETGEIILLIRTGKTDDIRQTYQRMNESYNSIIAAINNNIEA